MTKGAPALVRSPWGPLSILSTLLATLLLDGRGSALKSASERISLSVVLPPRAHTPANSALELGAANYGANPPAEFSGPVNRDAQLHVIRAHLEELAATYPRGFTYYVNDLDPTQTAYALEFAREHAQRITPSRGTPIVVEGLPGNMYEPQTYRGLRVGRAYLTNAEPVGLIRNARPLASLANSLTETGTIEVTTHEKSWRRLARWLDEAPDGGGTRSRECMKTTDDNEAGCAANRSGSRPKAPLALLDVRADGKFVNGGVANGE